MIYGLLCFGKTWTDGGAICGVKLKEKPCGKENFDRKWRMTVYNWIKVKLMYYSRIK